MINHLDNLLRHLFMTQINEISDESQVRFQPPDEEWRRYVHELTSNGDPLNALNVYLFDIRENRKLRSNKRTRQVQGGMVNEATAPAMLDGHYLISAWSPAAPSPQVEPTVDEHALLYEVARVLMNNMPLNPTRVYGKERAPLEKVRAVNSQCRPAHPGPTCGGLSQAGRILGEYGGQQSLEAGGLPGGDAAGVTRTCRSWTDGDDAYHRVSVTE